MQIFEGNHSYMEKWKNICNQEFEPGTIQTDRFTFGAKHVILVIGDDRYQVDAGLASENMNLMAEAMGIGCCFIGFFRTAAFALPELKQILNIPTNEQILNAMAVGYPAISYSRTVPKRKSEIRWL